MATTFEVWFDHAVIDSFPHSPQRPTTAEIDDAGNLVVVRDKQALKKYAFGTWHAAGTEIICASADDKADCPTCHPPWKNGGASSVTT